MSTALPQPTRSQLTVRSAQPLSGRPSTRSLLRWGALVLALHLGLLLSLSGSLDWSLSNPQALRTGPMQTRTITAPGATPPAPAMAAKPLPAARTRVALVEKPPLSTVPAPAPMQEPAPPQQAVSPRTKPGLEGRDFPPSPKPAASLPNQPLPPETATTTETATASVTAPSIEQSTEASKEPSNETAPTVLEANTDAAVPPPEAVTPNSSVTGQALAAQPRTEPNSAETPATAPPSDQPPSTALASPPAAAQALPAPASEPKPLPSPKPATPDRIASATLNLPTLDLASLPASALLSYRLTGQEKGLAYQATGELRWQRNASAYAMSLSVRAFLLGSRHWRSIGQIGPAGLSPTRFSDSWRSERAAHFDRPNQRIVFSNNAPSVALQAGAQDQVSLYVQLAAAMAQADERMPSGTRLQIQTATVRDALPWLLTLEKLEPVVIDGQSLPAVKWVCQPRNRFDAQVEIWVSAAHDWLPARIRITQVNGSFIDLQLTGREPLAELAATP
jgi:hypothetical protein